jgi:pyruvate formate lyase activating enzyme
MLGLCAGCALASGPGTDNRAAGADRPATPALSMPAKDEEARFVADARHWDADGDVVTCRLCPRECKVPPDERGYCGVRENRGGKYKTLVYARPCCVNVDPIEKKPLFHFLPGSQAFSLATAGCNIECKFCQNWQTSQVRPEQVESDYLPPARVPELTVKTGARSVAFTYDEPVVFYEYMFDIAAEARRKSLKTVMISNGYIQAKPMKQLLEHLSAVKIDLKSFSEDFYANTCHGHLQPVLETLALIKKAGAWLEIVVLIVPTLNDGAEECRRLAGWVLDRLGPDVPVHFTRFHPIYKLTNLPSTPVETLTRNREIALAAGLHYVYVGNVPGHPGESTCCPGCKRVVIERYGLYAKSRLKPDGACPDCGFKIPGVWA